MGFSPSVTCGVWVGYDSRQSLGEKETGAKAALPIWMTFMKAAIVGKDTEQFLGESPDKLLLKAAGAEPAKPALAQTAAAHPPVLIPANAKAAGLTKPNAPMAFVGPLGKPAGRLVGAPTPAMRSASTAAPVKTLVKPAMAPQVAPVADRQIAKIKSALPGQ
jgi:penicillin-binding protein 1A